MSLIISQEVGDKKETEDKELQKLPHNLELASQLNFDRFTVLRCLKVSGKFHKFG